MGLEQQQENFFVDKVITSQDGRFKELSDRLAFLETLEAGGAIYPTSATMWADERNVTAGNAITRTTHTSQIYNTYSYQNPPANGDSFTLEFRLKAGTYTLNVLGITDGSSGKIDWYFDNVLVVSGQDWYSAGVFNVLKSSVGLTVVGSGRHVLKGVVNGKNASSANYFIELTKLWLTPSSHTTEV